MCSTPRGLMRQTRCANGRPSIASSRCSTRSWRQSHRSSSPTRSIVPTGATTQSCWPGSCLRRFDPYRLFPRRPGRACNRWCKSLDESWTNCDKRTRSSVTQLEHKKPILKRTRRVVIKIGSQILSSGEGMEEGRLRGLVREIAHLHGRKKEVVVVSSGAVAAGMTRLGRKERPKTIPEKQALAAVGQIKLMALYERHFSKFDKSVAQVLLTHEDLANRQRYINAKHTFQMLPESSIIPIVNENDTVAVEEMKFGDNDHLSALVATLLEADLLIILSDVDGVYDKDPRAFKDAELIPLITEPKGLSETIAGATLSPAGTGGMATKLDAAEKASAAGIPTMIASGFQIGVLAKVLDDKETCGTLILP